MDPHRLAGVARIERVGWALRVPGDGPRRGKLGIVVRAIPVAHPLPDVPGHVVEPVSVRGKLRHGCDAGKMVRTGVVIGEMALISVGRPRAALRKLITPGIDLSRKAPTRSKLPFSLGREALSGPFRIGQCVLIRDLYYRKPLLPGD